MRIGSEFEQCMTEKAKTVHIVRRRVDRFPLVVGDCTRIDSGKSSEIVQIVAGFAGEVGKNGAVTIDGFLVTGWQVDYLARVMGLKGRDALIDWFKANMMTGADIWVIVWL